MFFSHTLELLFESKQNIEQFNWKKGPKDHSMCTPFQLGVSHLGNFEKGGLSVNLYSKRKEGAVKEGVAFLGGGAWFYSAEKYLLLRIIYKKIRISTTFLEISLM